MAFLTLMSFVMLCGNAGAVLCVKKDAKTGGPNAAAPVRAKASCASKEVQVDASRGFPSAAATQLRFWDVRINGAPAGPPVAAGSQFTLSFYYFIQDTGCTGCIEQIMVGYSGGPAPLGCAYDGIPGAAGHSELASMTLTAPATPGTYFIGWDRSADYGCPTSWWNGSPTPDRLLGVLVVQ
jgi:hypothetical protein